MKVLGIESSSLVASVALVTDDILTAEYTVNFKKTHSQTLLPMLDEIVKMLGLDLASFCVHNRADKTGCPPHIVSNSIYCRYMDQRLL